VDLQHSHQPPPRSRLINPVWSSQSYRSPPEDGCLDAGDSLPTHSGRESAEHHRGGRSHGIDQRNRGRDQEFVEHLRETGRNRWSLVSARKIPIRCLPADDPTIGTICVGGHARQDGTNPTDQSVYGGPCADKRRLHAKSHAQLLRHSKNLDVQIASGVCAAILTWTFTLGATDWPGAFSLFCCGPQVIEAATSGGKDANKQTNSLI
jgi:hypothetical protein